MFGQCFASRIRWWALTQLETCRHGVCVQVIEGEPLFFCAVIGRGSGGDCPNLHSPFVLSQLEMADSVVAEQEAPHHVRIVIVFDTVHLLLIFTQIESLLMCVGIGCRIRHGDQPRLSLQEKSSRYILSTDDFTSITFTGRSVSC